MKREKEKKRVKVFQEHDLAFKRRDLKTVFLLQ